MRKIWDIHGGIHPPENKNQSLNRPITPCPIPNVLVFPLSQHVGAAAKPIVTVGDHVLKGQLIAEAGAKVSASIHASTSGTVIAIEDRPIAHPSGLSAPCIVVEADGNDQWRERHPAQNWHTKDRSELLQIIADAGITGMGGAGFPTPIKLNPPPTSTINTLIINGTECEPYITADHILMRERAKEICEGVAILAAIINPSQILVGIEDNKPDVIAGMSQALNDAIEMARDKIPALEECDADVVVFPTKYPSGGEKQLIQILTGKEVPSGKLPADLGIVCQNVGTALAVHDAIVLDQPLISRITTATGENIKQPGNYEVRLGTPVSFFLEHAHYLDGADSVQRIVMGGPMMGYALASTEAPLVKTSNCILAPSSQEMPPAESAQPCIRCGHCATACPASLLPQQLYWFAQGKELDKLEQHNIADCIECGACAYVCPSNIPLVQYYRASKAELRQRKLDMQNAEHAKLRFEARQVRLARLEQEKIAARIARQKKAEANKRSATEDPKAAAVAAALERVNAKKQAAAKSQPTNPEADAQATIQQATVQDDPIAKALAARRAQQLSDSKPQQTSRETLDKALSNAQNKLQKARDKLEQAVANNDINVAAFETAVGKCEQKVQAAQEALDAFES